MFSSFATFIVLHLGLFSKCGASPILDIPQIVGTDSTLEFTFIPHQEDDIPIVWNASNPFPKYSLNSSPLYLVCDTDLTKRGGERRTKLTSVLGSIFRSVVTIMNTEDQSCYLIYTTKETILSKLSLENYSIKPWSHDVKLREDTIHKLETNKDPITINSLMFLEEKDENKTSIHRKLLDMAKNLLRIGHFSLKPSTKNGMDMENLCMGAYEHLAFTFSKKDENDLVEMDVNTNKMESYFSSRGVREDCLLTFILSQVFLPSVISIEIQSKYQVMNDNAQFIVQDFADKKTPWYDVGLDGNGEVVAVSDTGVDMNNCYFWDNDSNSAVGKEIDLTKRKVVQYDEYANSFDEHGHGTHVSGSVCGHRSVNGSADDESDGVANGIAYNAKLAMIDIGNIFGLDIPDIKERLLTTGRPYANVHSASWGSIFNMYDGTAKRVDDYLYDNDDFVFVVAAGNSGSSDAFSSLGSPATAKNGITVGATESFGADLAEQMFGPDYVASFSSKGPTSDGRTKPDVLAPGYFILSAGANLNEPGACDPNGDPPRTTDGGKDGLASSAGTSMATPMVSGVAALVRQYFREGFYPSGERNENDAIENPSSALIKAVILNGGQPVIGVNNSPDGFSKDDIFRSLPYDYIQNYGRVSLVDSLYLKGKSNIHSIVWDRQTIKEGEKKAFSVTIDHKSDQNCTQNVFSATLVWMDKPGFPFCAYCLKIDMDLSVTKNEDTDTIYFPNGLTGKRDDRNNAERVQVGVSHGDAININVEGYNFDSDEEEKFALVATGCFAVSDSQAEPIEYVKVA